jgi:oligopeptidase B
VEREKQIWKRWSEITKREVEQWSQYLMQRYDPGLTAQIPEKYGDYLYFVANKQLSPNYFSLLSAPSQTPPSNLNYTVYCRRPVDGTEEETVLDLVDVPWLKKRSLPVTVVDKIKMNKDHSLVAFTLDIGNTETYTAGLKDMANNRVDPLFQIHHVSQIEFFGGRPGNDIVFYVETDESNRPHKVIRRSLRTAKEWTVFQDDNPTHYLDLVVSKDKKYLFINSGTKEDCEVWVIPDWSSHVDPTTDLDFEGEESKFTPELLVAREEEVRVHVDHVRDFFIKISNDDSSSKDFRIQTLKDASLQTPVQQRKASWETMLESQGEGMESVIINEFDCFQDFIAVYVTKANSPQVLVKDLNSGKISTLQVNQGDIGRIEPMLN